MPARVFLNKGLIKEAFESAAVETLEEVGERIAADARRRAPIRKVFREKKGFRRRFRSLTEGEKRAAIARANRYYTAVRPDEFQRRRAVAHIANYGQAEVRRRGSANAVGSSAALRFLGLERGGRFTSATGARRVGRGFEPGPEARKAMTARGRYEATSGRAISREEGGGSTKVKVGGSLKASITEGPVAQTGNGQKITVGAYIRYAKFVEFPTIRTAAQPFLLPALHGQREAFPRLLGAKVRQKLQGR